MEDELKAAWGEACTKYTIHEETLSYFRKLKALGTKAYEDSSPEEIRGQLLRRADLFAGCANFTGSEQEYTVPGEENKGASEWHRLRIISSYFIYEGVRCTEEEEQGYYLRPADVCRVPTILVYFHGGGLVAGSRNIPQPFLKNLASRARCMVVNVEYRLAPEHKAPAAFDDCRAATRWVLQNKTRIGGHVDSQVGVAGDSAGGQLAASITHDVTGLAFQILVYPVTDVSQNTPSYREFVKTPGLNAVGMRWYIQHFLANEGQKTDPVICPLLRPSASFKGLPPALCILAELDPLRDEGQAYFEKLDAAGVSTEILLVKGAPHAFFLLSGHFKQITKAPHQKVQEFVKRFQSD
ncbi:hypothetical protein BaRGS_00015196 [Batillaria attramentaria]|uniref:Alpha/beta hydrolase fold-3 domain-containing protein n=1 Tax=Batillaria attramentaria TaxID=370345 RepID=A0ABD0L2E4_9CAEN